MRGQLREAPEAAPAGGSIWRRLPVGWLLLGLLVAAAAVLRPKQLLTTLQSPRALALILAVALLTMLLRRGTRRLPAPVSSLLPAVPALLAMTLLVLPTLRSTTVNDDLADLPPREGAAATSGIEPPDPAAAPVRLTTGNVEGIGHGASGSASLVQLPGGELVLRFEDLEVDPGPDYRVHLVAGAGRTSPGEGTELADLKGTSGNQNYPLQDAVPDLPLTALIWCEAFGVAIAAASLQ